MIGERSTLNTTNFAKRVGDYRKGGFSVEWSRVQWAEDQTTPAFKANGFYTLIATCGL